MIVVIVYAGKIIDNDEEVVYEIDDEAVIYNPEA